MVAKGTEGEDIERTEELVRRASAGSEDSFGSLFTRLAPALHSWATLRVRPALRSRVDPEDLVQEVCCRAYQGFGNFDPERGAFRGWIFGIANRVLTAALTDLSRGPATTRPAALDEATRFLDQVPDDATQASRRVARDDSLHSFLQAAESLGEEEQKLFVYRGLEGLPHEEVARLIGVETETAKKRWQRLRDRLRTMRAPDDLF